MEPWEVVLLGIFSSGDTGTLLGDGYFNGLLVMDRGYCPGTNVNIAESQEGAPVKF